MESLKQGVGQAFEASPGSGLPTGEELPLGHKERVGIVESGRTGSENHPEFLHRECDLGER